MCSGDDGAQRDEVVLDEDADVFMNAEVQVCERVPECCKVFLRPSAAAKPVEGVGHKVAGEHLVKKCAALGVDGVNEGAGQFVEGLGRLGLVKAVQTGGGKVNRLLLELVSCERDKGSARVR